MVKPKYYLVERTLLPEVFQRVIEANEAIASGKAATASEAAKLAGLSRSAYYKYKDGVRPFFEATTDRITVRDTTIGKELQVQIDDLKNLLAAYRSGQIKERK